MLVCPDGSGGSPTGVIHHFFICLHDAWNTWCICLSMRTSLSGSSTCFRIDQPPCCWLPVSFTWDTWICLSIARRPFFRPFFPCACFVRPVVYNIGIDPIPGIKSRVPAHMMLVLCRFRCPTATLLARHSAVHRLCSRSSRLA